MRTGYGVSSLFLNIDGLFLELLCELPGPGADEQKVIDRILADIRGGVARPGGGIRSYDVASAKRAQPLYNGYNVDSTNNANWKFANWKLISYAK